MSGKSLFIHSHKNSVFHAAAIEALEYTSKMILKIRFNNGTFKVAKKYGGYKVADEINDNDNDIENLKSNNNINDNDVKTRRYEQGKKVETLVDEIVRKFKKIGVEIKEGSMLFLYKAAWRLSEARIWGNVEQALKGTNPMGLFIYLCKRDGV